MRSILAAPPAPPDGKKEGITALVVLIVMTLFFAEWGWSKWASVLTAFGLGVAAAMAVNNSADSRKKFAAYQELHANWVKRRMCLRCGNFYAPEVDEK